MERHRTCGGGVTIEDILSDLTKGNLKQVGIKAARLALVSVLAMAGYQIGTYFFTTLINAGKEYIEYPMVIASIEQVRRDSERVPCESANQFVDRIAGWNSYIADKKAALGTWYYRPITRRAWSEVPSLRFPCGLRK
jgi:hypothetical protein